MIRYVKGGVPDGPKGFQFPEQAGLKFDRSVPLPRFSIVRKRGDVVELIPEAGSAPILVDGRPVTAARQLWFPCSIADSHIEPKVLFGFDPRRKDGHELWEVKASSGSSVELDKVTKTWPGNVGLKEVTFHVTSNQFIGVYGPSGSGKTTLVELILGLIASKGISVDGVAPSQSASVGYLPQIPEMPETIRGRHLINLALANRGVLPWHWNDVRSEALRVAHLGKADLKKREIKTLSGGERRRLALACVMCKRELRLLVADEPTTGLDPLMERDVMLSLRGVSRRGITVIVVTHSANLVDYFDRVLVLRRRDGSAAQVGYDGPWEPETVSRLSGMDHPTDVDRIGWLTSNEYPPYRQEVPIPSIPVARAEGRRPRYVAQAYRWFRCAQGMQWRESRALGMTLLMSLLCVLALQIGLGDEERDSARLGVLSALAAPWLTAMYSVTTTCSLLKLFALESFSGARPLPFVLAAWSSFLLPSLLVALVFWGGLEWQPKVGVIIERLSYSPAKAPGASAEMGDCAGVIANKENWLAKGIRKFWPEFRPAKPSRWLVWRSPVAQIREDRYLFPHPYHTLDEEMGKFGTGTWVKGAVQAFVGLFLCCALASVIGIAASATTKSDKAASVACVVIFVVFLVLSRVVISNPALMGPWSEWTEVVEQRATMSGGAIDGRVQLLIPVLLSFGSLSRYSFNLLFFPAQEWTTLIKEAVLAVGLFGVVPLLIAVWNLRRKNVVLWYFSRG